MGIDYVTTSEVEVALDRCNGTDFERFCHSFFSIVLGQSFIPLGGMHDGGADGVILNHVHDVGRESDHFFQASVQENATSKIKSTIDTLRNNGRNVAQLTYATSQAIRLPDSIEAEIENSHGVRLRIRDASFFKSHVNDKTQLVRAFREILGPYISHLAHGSNVALPTPSPLMLDPTVYVFLRQEVDREADEPFVNSVTDALCLWALRDTDPDADNLKSASAVRDDILQVIPSVEHLIDDGRIQRRLEHLSSKSNPSGRQVRWHRKDNQFALPFETRQSIAARSAEDEALKIRVLERLENRAFELAPKTLTPRRVAMAALSAIQMTFETRGLQFASFIEEGEVSPSLPDLEAPVRDAIDSERVSKAARDDFFIATLATVRNCLYNAGDDEREYLRRLAKTYSMLFVLRQDPKIVGYIQEMSSKFNLYVGSDILIQALSEQYLDEENKSAQNLLHLARTSGATLVLTEPVLEECITHLRAADREFTGSYAEIETAIIPELVPEIPRIMIRAYFYNRRGPSGPASWPKMIDQFVDYTDLHQIAAQSDLHSYFVNKFGMEYEDRRSLDSLTSEEDVSALTEALLERKNNKYELARNDALMAHVIYRKRAEKNEYASASIFGLSTWWLTNETRILRHTRDLVQSNGGARYMMRPDFLLNFLLLTPDIEKVRETYRKLFPSTLGLELSHRMDPAVVKGIVGELKQANSYEESRRAAVMAKCVDTLKADFRRRHLFSLSDTSLDTPAL